MAETRKLAAIFVADVAGYSRLIAADEEGTIARLRVLRHELIDPVIATHKGRTVKTTGDGRLVEFGSVVDAVRCAIEVQQKMAMRNSDVAPGKRIDLRVGIHLGDVVVESDGDLMGDGVNVAARLESIAEPGGICLSDDAYRQAGDKVDAEFLDLGEQRLKNIARPVRAYAVVPIPAAGRGTMPGEGLSVPAREAPPRLSIVVLPFTNIGGDAEQEYFVDGVTESLTTDLSRISGSFVIARNTAFTYKGKPIDVKRIGRDLNVRYVLEGSVQRGGNRLRVNVQLIDAESGNHLWAERFDKPLADIFDMQDEIVARLANQLGNELIVAEARRSEKLEPNQLSSLDLTMRGWACIADTFTSERSRQAQAYFRDAIRMDDKNGQAYIGLAFAIGTELVNLAAERPSEVSAEAEDAIAKAYQLAPKDPRLHTAHGRLLRTQGMGWESLREHELAVQLDRNYAQAYAEVGIAKVFVGRAEEATAHIADAMRLSPRDPRQYINYYLLGLANLYLGHLESAADHFRKSIELARTFGPAYIFLAATLALSGDKTGAGLMSAQGLRLIPNFTISRFRAQIRSNEPVYLQQRERVDEGLRKAGVPEK